MLAFVISALIALIFLIWTCFKLCICHMPSIHRAFNNIFGPQQNIANVHLYLKLFSSPSNGVIYYLTDLHYEKNLLNISNTPYLREADITGCCLNATLHLTWSDSMLLYIHAKAMNLDLPATLPVPWNLISQY